MNTDDYNRIVGYLGDQRWRINNLYWIKDKHGRKVKFKMNWAQEEQFNDMHYFNLDLKARQLGMTTFWCIYALDLILFNDNCDTGIIAHKREDADAFFINKIQYAYENLPQWLLDEPTRMPKKNEAGWLILNNNSSIRVSTSMRSGTIQFLHVSEFGKICAAYPEKAREIVTGAAEAVPKGGVFTIESTAEGATGYFHSYCMEAIDRLERNIEPTMLDWKMFFFPWWKEKDYSLNEQEAERVVLKPVLEEYFLKLKVEHGIHLTKGQKCWYQKKMEKMEAGLDDESSGTWDDLKREHPSYPREAFEQSVRGSYYISQFSTIQKEGRICQVPHQGGTLVDTWWDLGVGDSTSIVFTQTVGRSVHIIDYYENSGEGLAHYANELRQRSIDHHYVYGRQVAPHDIVQREMTSGKSRFETAAAMGIHFEIAPKLKVEDGIEAVRKLLSICFFDEKKCDRLLKALKAYRKEYDAGKAVWRDKPRHDKNSHPADAFRTFGVAHTFEAAFNPNESLGGAAEDMDVDAWS